jgi:hypothetical protein
VKAGLAGTGLGGIGHIAGIVSSGDAGAGFGITGNGASFDAAAGTAHGSDSAVGGIASITGRSSTTSLSSFGIAGGTFRAIGDIGAITGSSAVSGGIALTGVTVSTGGNLASVTATGNVKVSKFLPI